MDRRTDIIIANTVLNYTAQPKTPLNLICTSSSAVAEKPRCRVHQFWPNTSVLAQMLSCFFIWMFLRFLLDKSGVICKSRLATLTARWHQRWHSLPLQRWVSSRTKCTFNGTSPQTICAQLDRPVNALQLCR